MQAENLSTTKSATPKPEVAIAGITHPVILKYFESFNAEHYAETAALFAPDGVLYPPFEQGVEGPAAIAAYLETEAEGMCLSPRQGVLQSVEVEGAETTQVQVTGTVQTPLFGVNVRWTFVLNPAEQITSVRIKLLASPQELLNLR